MAESNPPAEPNGFSFIPISLTGDTDPVTGVTTVNFAATMDYPGSPDLTLQFGELRPTGNNTVALYPVHYRTAVVVTWNNGVANFSFLMNNAIFSQLSSRQTNFGVTAKINDPDVDSWGMVSFGINLPPA